MEKAMMLIDLFFVMFLHRRRCCSSSLSLLTVRSTSGH